MDNGYCNLSLKEKKFNSAQSNSLNNLGKHLLRMEKEKDNLIDNSKSHTNEVLIKMSEDTLNKSLKTFLSTNAIQVQRKDSVVAYQMIFSCDKKTFDNPELLEKWKLSTMDFIKNTPPFVDNCLLAVFHKDETQPHIQAVFVPRDNKTNKLGFNKILGGFQGGQKLSALHDEYAKYHTPLGFKRGDGTNTNDIDHKKYMRSISELSKPVEPLPPVPKEEKNLIGFTKNKDAIIAALKKQIKILSSQYKKLTFYATQNNDLKKINITLKQKAKASILNEKKLAKAEQKLKSSAEKEQRYKQLFNENIKLKEVNKQLSEEVKKYRENLERIKKESKSKQSEERQKQNPNLFEKPKNL